MNGEVKTRNTKIVTTGKGLEAKEREKEGAGVKGSAEEPRRRF